MQKVIMVSLLVFIIGGRLVYAEVPQVINENKPNIQQDEFLRVMEDNLSFEKEKRQLVNEVALEKLRSELKKLRGTTTSPVMPVATDKNDIREEFSQPTVILVSKIGGLTRVLVSAAGDKLYLSKGERFSSGGKNYILEMDGTGKYQVKEHK
ncbi:hypothetical protein [Citrobacter arsenatis]|uniref:hypothetical protein n=1 Tax=Citrobacter arsenatis TaxID=2546350 RepID=UPI00300E13A5